MGQRIARARSFFLWTSGLILFVGGSLYFLISKHSAWLSMINTPGKWQNIVARGTELFPAVLVIVVGAMARLYRNVQRQDVKIKDYKETITDREEQIVILQEDNRILRDKIVEFDKNPPLRATQVVKLVKEGVEAAQKSTTAGIPAEIGEGLEYVVKAGPEALQEAITKVQGLQVLFDRLNGALLMFQAHQAKTGTPQAAVEEKSTVVQAVVSGGEGTTS